MCCQSSNAAASWANSIDRRWSRHSAKSPLKAAPLPCTTVNRPNALLRRLDNEGTQGLATINSNFEFNAVWGRAEILQAQGKIPQVKIWQPPASAAPESFVAEHAATRQSVVAPAARDQLMAELPQPVQSVVKNTPVEDMPAATQQPAATISIVREIPASRKVDPIPRGLTATAAERSSEVRPLAENLHREIENGRMAINTLAALDIPLLACHGSGSEIFHNRSFQDVRLRDAMHLKTEDLVLRAKDAIAESALKGDLDIDKAVKLKQAPRGYACYCKAIRDYENPSSRAFGYIFWLTPTSPPSPLSTAWRGGEEAGTALYSAAEGSAEFTGKTLPEILAAEETRAMAWAMAEANGNQSDAALLLGIPRQTFNYRYRKLTRLRPTGNRQIKEQAPRKSGKPSVEPDAKTDEAGKA